MNSPRRRCFIHVGLPKTGTSFLQNTFWQSDLRELDVTMLPAKRNDHYRVAIALRGMLDEAVDPPASFTVLDRLPDEAGEVTASAALLSQEALAPATVEEAGRLVAILEDFEIHVVVTARDLARQLPSAWQQRIQSRLTHGYDEFLDAVVGRLPLADDFWRNQDLVDVVRRWSSHVPADRVHVVTVPAPGTVTTSLLDRFCEVLGVDPGRLTSDQPGSGGSLGLVQAEVLRRVNLSLGDRLPTDRSGYARVGRAFLAAQVLRPQGGEHIELPTRLRPWCQETAASWSEQLADGGYHIVGDLGDLSPPDGAFTGAAQEVTDTQVAESATAALATVLELRSAELAEIAQLRARNAAQRRKLQASEEPGDARDHGDGAAGRQLRRARAFIARRGPTG